MKRTHTLTHQLLVEDEGSADARRQAGADDQQEGDRSIVVVLIGGAHSAI